MGAIADADRRLSGRGAVGFVRFGDEAEGAGVDVDAVVGGERGCSVAVAVPDPDPDRGVARPLLCDEGGFELLGDELESFCDNDCERCRKASSEAFFLLSWLLVDKCPGV